MHSFPEILRGDCELLAFATLDNQLALATANHFARDSAVEVAMIHPFDHDGS